MSDESTIERGELLIPTLVSDGDGPVDGVDTDDDASQGEMVSEPGKVMRVGSMIKQLLEEVRTTTLDEPSRKRLREIYDTSVRELGSALSDDLRLELERLAFPFSDDSIPTEIELRIAQAQLVGWLEGLFHGIQATLFAQQVAARQQLEKMRGELGPGSGGPGSPGGPGGMGAPSADGRPGTYL